MNTYFGGGPFIQNEKVDDVEIRGSENYIKAVRPETMTTVGAALRFQVPFAFNKFIVAPFGEARLGLTNITTLAGDNRSDRLFFGIGGGAYVTYYVTDNFAPMVGVQYMHSKYSVVFKDLGVRSNGVLIFAGVKLFER